MLCKVAKWELSLYLEWRVDNMRRFDISIHIYFLISPNNDYCHKKVYGDYAFISPPTQYTRLAKNACLFHGFSAKLKILLSNLS